MIKSSVFLGLPYTSYNNAFHIAVSNNLSMEVNDLTLKHNSVKVNLKGVKINTVQHSIIDC